MGGLLLLKSLAVRTKEQDRERKRAERLRDPAKARQKDAARRARNPKGFLVSRAKSRAARAGVPFDLTENDFELPDLCPVLGIPLKVMQGAGKQPHDCSPSLDRIRPELGYVRGNVAVISQRANRIKNDSTVDEVRLLLRWMENL